MATFIRRVLSVLTRTVVILTAWHATTAGPSAATDITGRGASIGTTQVPYIFDIAPDPSEPGSVFLATQAGLYRARPDGTAERISQKQNPIWGLSVGGVNATWLLGRGFADDSRTEAVIVSEDQGRSWQRLPSTGERPRYLRVVEASKASPYVAYAAGDVFWRSTDGGQVWVSTSAPPGRVLNIAASAIDAQRVFAATTSDLHVSENGGFSWQPVSGARCWQPVTTVDTGTDGVVYAFSLCAGLIRGNERTGSWAVVNDRFGSCIVQHLAVDPRNSANVYAVLHCNKVIMSADGGATWRELGSREIWEPRCVPNPVSRIDADS